ncbi:F-box only protein 10 isoform X1 [Dromaius novaehollandiae]|uniref:F-box only protein 10 isoform X1 n=1 Tax=Dromaius novaehollandiae TaxID=8790 RepID=UPI000E1F2C36|nr:F-box only protein 10 isoform X1 [Dromaius novaehollandiae]XP_025955117.1 F-box only protein 10 isoform X1 [Dromaius novaehollandiae]XP_025955118.1 F-box only protein 10 isoform X1 [Dromaius novaehollandiae]XP_025955119.1 F-box only protein 10 isoform X1 [Dromaius novaehollandiae]XP_025955120.1 F-box only protein 10 isoform X1 [Dromaius novaehollandiae]XP_025955121.1 F-box only protein 10 isoform X1 [Dromaius novaehollandiae]XP_025955122.1 F-box only protein 10 isoform X1 [Dromaius novaeho
MMEISDLPEELWQLILSYLHLADLGRCSLVCRAWYELILSLDKTRWRQLCLGCIEYRHPNWPNQPDVEPQSWRETFKQHYLASKTWTKNTQDLESSNCFYLFRRRKDRRLLCVGTGCEFDSLRAALATASPYDRIMLLPGMYEEHSEVVLKVPVEIVGQGKLGDVVLLVSFDQHCPTTRLCNVVFMPARFTPVLYKTTSGYVQFDNCNFENGQLQIHAPGTCQVKFCTFSQSSIHFHSVALCILENCEFTGSENASVTVEGCPTSDWNWACKHLSRLAKSYPVAVQVSDPAFCTMTRQERWRNSLVGTMKTHEIGAGEERNNLLCAQAMFDSASKHSEFTESLRAAKEKEYPTLDSNSSDSDLCSEDEEGDQAVYKLPYKAHSLRHMLTNVMHSRLQSNRLRGPHRDLKLKSLQQELQQDKEAQSLANSLLGCIIRQCLFRNGKGGIFIYSRGQAKLEGSIFRDLTYAVRCIQNSKVIMLKNDIHHCKASGIFLRLSAGGLIANNNIHSNCEAGVDIRKGANPLVLCNKIHSGLRSGIVVVGNGKGIIRSNQIYGNKEAGIYILYNGNPAVSGNYIFQGLAAGIAVNENGRGQITENIICENQWGGADIRRGADPVLKNNLISCGYSDGVVVGECGKGLIEGNTICGNKGCGVWMMSSSLPHVTNNQISHNSIYGVAVLCHKDDASDYAANQGGSGNFHEEREGASWENDLDSEEEYLASRHPITVALVELNSINQNGAAGLYVKSSEALNIIANVIHANRNNGVAVLQSTQLTCIANNSISCNSLGGVLVEAECQVELRGNGIYDNSSHGIVSKGNGIIVENDIIGNHRCGLQLLQAADMKVIFQVTKNRIQSFRDYGIVLFDQVKGLVQENLIFQGRSKKSILQPISNTEDCIVQNNILLTLKKRFDVECMLMNPSARPHIEGTAHGSSMARGSQISKVTRVDKGCHNQGSIFCAIL